MCCCLVCGVFVRWLLFVGCSVLLGVCCFVGVIRGLSCAGWRVSLICLLSGFCCAVVFVVCWLMFPVNCVLIDVICVMIVV